MITNRYVTTDDIAVNGNGIMATDLCMTLLDQIIANLFDAHNIRPRGANFIKS
jgi:hypothetical protein